MPNPSFSDFVEDMKAYQRYNIGKEIKQLRNIYIKYIYKGSKNVNKTEILYENVIELLNTAETIEDVEEVQNMIDELDSKKIIHKKEYNYIQNLIQEKRNELI